MEGFKTSSLNRIGDNNIITILDREKPDLLFMDYHLGSIDTKQFALAIRNNAEWQNLPVVMTSAIDYSRACLAAGATDFIVKPFNWEDVTRRIRIILGTSV
jgi:DNA-binding response OmpR family regulator